jgi:hypothetical protein
VRKNEVTGQERIYELLIQYDNRVSTVLKGTIASTLSDEVHNWMAYKLIEDQAQFPAKIEYLTTDLSGLKESSLALNVGTEQSIANQYARWYVWHNFKIWAEAVKIQEIESPDNVHFIAGKNPIKHEDDLRKIDAIGLALAPMNLDGFADFAGGVYCLLGADIKNAKIYGASFFIPVASGGSIRMSKTALKEVDNGTKVIGKLDGTIKLWPKLNFDVLSKLRNTAPTLADDVLLEIHDMVNKYPKVANNFSNQYAELLVKASEGRTKVLAQLNKLDDAALSSLTKDLENNAKFAQAFFDKVGKKPELVESWEKVMNAAENGAPILRKDINILTSLSKFDDNLISKIGTDRFDNFMKKLVEAHPKCKTCGNAGDALVGNMDDVLDDFYKVVIERAVKADGSLVTGFDDFLKEAGEQASKAKGAALTLKKLSRNWDEIAEGGWHLERFEGTIPDIETGHKLDALLKRTNPTTGADEFKSLEMKNWSSARSITGDTYSQFKAYITSGNKFEYYFSDGLTDALKGNFQNVFKDATKAEELWDLNSSFFRNLGEGEISSLDELIEAATDGDLIDLIDWVK